MKTGLTLSIEKALQSYYPSVIGGHTVNKHRARHLAFECTCESGTTSAGIVDCVRVDEYFSNVKDRHFCFWKVNKKDGIMQAYTMDQCKAGYTVDNIPLYCDEPGCVWKRFIKGDGTPDILITCYEIKITKADFKSKNGHNFIGNCNFYVVPKEIYKDIVDLVPPDIGIITYDGNLRRVKDSTYRKLTDEEQKWLLLCVLKKNRIC